MWVLAANAPVVWREVYQRGEQRGISGCGLVLLRWWSHDNNGFETMDRRREDWRKKIARKRDCRAEAFWPDLSRPTSVEMEPITDSDHLDQILLKAQQHSQPILIDWMASWCRKCIYLKPKLEKLAAEYDTKIRVYYVDVNKVPKALVKRGNISKMPTIQLWKDGEMKEEVIGGHKAWLVIDEVRAMIQKFV